MESVEKKRIKHEWINNSQERKKRMNEFFLSYEYRCDITMHFTAWASAIRIQLEKTVLQWCTARTLRLPLPSISIVYKRVFVHQRSTSDYWLLFGLITLCAMHLKYSIFGFFFLSVSLCISQSSRLKFWTIPRAARFQPKVLFRCPWKTNFNPFNGKNK